MLHLSMLQMKGLAGLAGPNGEWVWTGHDADWIFPGGPDNSLEDLHNPYFNQWDELDSSPQKWAEPFKIEEPFTTEPWQLDVNGIY